MSQKKVAAVFAPITSLKPNPRNPRKNKSAIPEVAVSITKFGFGAPLVCNKDGTIIAGHTRYQAAVSLGMKEVPVRFLDLSEKMANAMMLADNRLGERSHWDEEMLTDFFRELEPDLLHSAGFDLAYIDSYLGLDSLDGLTAKKREWPTVPKECSWAVFRSPDNKTWTGAAHLGPNKDLVGMVPKKLTTVVTDPPYELSGSATMDMIESLSDRTATMCAVGKQLQEILRYPGWSLRFEKVWVRKTPHFTQNAFAVPLTLHGPILDLTTEAEEVESVPYLSKGDTAITWKRRLRNEPTVIRTEIEYEPQWHPHAKSADLFRQMLMGFRSPWIIDPFMGSGASLIAAASEKKNYLGAELDRETFRAACARAEASGLRVEFLAAGEMPIIPT